jgi:5-formyltetrahydrofolate cyclo-ligase
MTMSAENHTADAISAAKHAARQRAQQARECLDLTVCRAHAVSVARLILALPELADVGTVLTYAAMPAELDPSFAITALRQDAVRIGYTRIEAPGVLGVHVVESETELIPGPLSIRQPSEALPRVPFDEIDAVIVPGVAFDESGGRLGYGGGYFDRLLPMLRDDCTRIGVAFDEQVLEEIPAEEHDAYVDIVVTPTRVIRSTWRNR